MNCSKCGAVLNPGDIMCSNCGNPVQNIPVQVIPSGDGIVNPNNTTVNMSTQTISPIIPKNAGELVSNSVNPSNSSQNSNKSFNFLNDKNKLLVFGIAGLGILIIFIGIVLGATGDKKEEKKDNKNESETVSTIKYSYLDYDLPYLDGYLKQVSDEGLVLLDEKNNIQILLSFFEEISLSDFKESLPSIKTSLINNGFTFDDEEDKTISNVSWHLINVNLDNDGDKIPGLFCFASMREDVVLLAQVFNLSGVNKSFDYTLNNLSKMILEANYHKEVTKNDNNNKSKTIIIPDFVKTLPGHSNSNVG